MTSSTVAVVAPVASLVVVLVLGCLVDLRHNTTPELLPRWAWAVAVVLVIPLGPIAYLTTGRRSRDQARGAVEPPQRSVVVDRSLDPGPGAARRSAPPIHAQDPPAAVTGRAVSYHYPSGSGLFEVDVNIVSGDLYGLVGRNGAGKTTLLSLIGGLKTPTDGAVRIGHSFARTVMCPDVPVFEPWLTVHEVARQSRTLAMGSRRYGRSGDTAVVEALADVGLLDARDRRVAELSRGMAQRLGLAAALVAQPHLLILDEPMSGLDPPGREDMLNLLTRLRGRCTVIFSSHLLHDIERTASTIGILEGGRLVFEGPPDSFIDAWTSRAWEIDVRSGRERLCRVLAEMPWVLSMAKAGPGRVQITVGEGSAAEHELAGAVAESGAALVRIDRIGANLDAAYSRMLAHCGGSSGPLAPGRCLPTERG